VWPPSTRGSSGCRLAEVDEEDEELLLPLPVPKVFWRKVLVEPDLFLFEREPGRRDEAEGPEEDELLAFGLLDEREVWEGVLPMMTTQSRVRRQERVESDGGRQEGRAESKTSSRFPLTAISPCPSPFVLPVHSYVSPNPQTA
jgi:hypothetical protein